MRFAQIEVRIIQWPQPRLILRPQQVGRIQASLCEAFRWQIAATNPKIRRDITQDIDQLKALAKTHSVRKQKCIVKLGSRKKMRAADSGPKLTNATSDAIGIIIQFGIGAQRNDRGRRGRAESAQVQFLAARDDLENLLNQLTI